MNTGVHVLFSVLVSSGYMPWSGIAGSFSGFEEEMLNFYKTSFSFCHCNSACPLQSLDHVGDIVLESGDLQY